MAKKQKSFAEKASSKGEKELVHVKYVKSVKSDKEGFWRFNESIISMEKGQNLDVALKELEDAANMVDIAMPGSEEEAVENEVPVSESPVEAPVEETKEETPAEEAKEEAPVEETKEEAPAEEAKEEAPVEETKEEESKDKSE